WTDHAKLGGLPSCSATVPMMFPIRGSPERYTVGRFLTSDLFNHLPSGAAPPTGALVFVDSQTGETGKLINVHDGQIIDAAMVPGTSLVVSLGDDRSLALTDAAKAETINGITLPEIPSMLAVSADAKTVAIGHKGGVRLYRLPDLSEA